MSAFQADMITAARKLSNRAYVRAIVERRGWTKQIDGLAMIYVSLAEAYEEAVENAES